MKYLILSLTLLLSCSFIYCQSIRLVLPSNTDPAIDIENNKHVIYPPASSAIDKLLVFLPGTFGSPLGYRAFMEEASKLGYHVIGLQYVNSEAVNSICATSTDALCAENARKEIIFGDDLHPDVEVNYANSIENRTVKLLTYLSTNFNSENWAQFLTNDSVNWENTTWAGHSQGGGHSAFLGTIKPLDRVIMMGSLDWLPQLGQLASWQNPNGVTPTSKYFGFAHEQDELAGYNGQKAGWQALEMIGADSPTSIDGLQNIQTGLRCFKSNATPNNDPTGFHGCTTVTTKVPVDSQGNLLYIPIWKYMLNTATATTGLVYKTKKSLKIFPNPTQGITTIEDKNISDIKVISSIGQIIFQIENNTHTAQITLPFLTPGIYHIHITYTDGNLAMSKLIYL